MNSTTARAWQRLLVASAFVALSACGGGSSEEEQPTPPAAPTGLTATAAGHSRIDLAWTDRSGDETGFKIERSSTSASAGFVALHTTGSNESLWGDTTVSPATHYWYRVRATNAAGDSAWSNVADATTDPAPVAAPTNLAAVATSPVQVQLTWVDHAANEDGFELQRSGTSATAGFVQIGLEAADATATNDGAVAPGTTYWYRIRAYNVDGTSGWSNVATVTTPTGLPGAPTGVLATARSPTTAEVSWTAPAFGSPTYYEVQYRTVGGYWYSGCTLTATSCTVQSLSQSTAYEFQVIAYNGYGAGPASAIASATTPSGLPGAPTGVAATANTPTTADVSWTAPAFGSPTYYEVQYRTVGGFWYSGCTVTATSCTVQSLSQSTAYEFQVIAYNNFGAGPASAIASATTPSGLPGAPTGVAATANTPTTADVSWTAPAFGSPTYYEVQYRTVGGFWYSGCTVTATSCTVQSLSQSTAYEFQVIAYNNFGAGPASAIASATTPSGLPGAPTGVLATANTPTTADVSWTAPAFGSPTSYDVQYRTVGGFWYSGCTVTATSCTVQSLSQSTAYEFQVIAYNSFGYGPPSDVATAITPSAPP